MVFRQCVVTGSTPKSGFKKIIQPVGFGVDLRY